MMLKHRYGENVHIFNDSYLSTVLAKLCMPQTVQPLVNRYVEMIYHRLITSVIDHEFPKTEMNIPTRMAEFHPKQAILKEKLVDPNTKAVVTNLARAGTLPSHLCYETLNYFLNPSYVRQDHFSIARQVNDSEKVTGAQISGHKIGGTIDDSILIIPDPMAATGGSIVQTLKEYHSFGTPNKIVLVHCIVTPEYLKNVLHHFPNAIIYAVRCDRGLSDAKILDSEYGTYWDQEKGLNDKSYIVPGGGGFGEIMNNSFV